MYYINKLYTYSSGITADAFILTSYTVTQNYTGEKYIHFTLTPYLDINAYYNGRTTTGDDNNQLELSFNINEASLDLTLGGHEIAILTALTNGVLICDNGDSSFFSGGVIQG